ncbi:TonB-dependent receptor [uncultured Sunxiuqinia sp.]|uniref:TonB-dependent receptor n=1 Tax=uncultured Sunxiuqinia sp. TaxID=1573825 RepID=UPI002AA91AD7|nr:TonB-dependent receptor [uncultured Sunxiuqinia sp.]
MKKNLLCNDGGLFCGLSRLIRIMKLTTFLLLVAFIGAQARGLSQTADLNLKVQEQSVKDVLRQIEDQSDYFFMYNDTKIDVQRKVNLDLENEKISEVLDALFEGTNTKYIIKNRQIVLYPKGENQSTDPNQSLTNQQVSQVSGVVSDSQGPLPGVTIVVKGTTQGTVTDLDGKYTISNLPDNAVLVFSFVGMKPKEVPARKSTINVTMEESSIGLDEVVAVGYGTVKRGNLTGSVSSIQGETLEKIPVTSTAEAMSGRLAGVQITTADGSPDAEVIVRVRGGGSITGDNSPLYIVDGFPASSISDVSPTDIESINVLKDAASTAIYGSQGANGVIIITTKSAKGGKTQVNYNAFVQTKKLKNQIDVLGPYEYVMLNYEFGALGGEDGINSFEKKFGVFDDIDLYKFQEGTDWQENMFGSSVLSQQHNISIQGGNEVTKYSLSGTYDYNGGLMKNNNYKRYNFNFKLNHKLTDNLTLDLNARVSDATVNGAGTSGDTYKVRTSDALTKGPVNGLSDFTQVNPGSLADDEYEQWIKDNLTLEEQAAQYWKRKYQKDFKFTGAINWEIVEGLIYRLEGGYSYGFDERQNYWGQYTSNASFVGGQPLVDWEKSNSRSLRQAQTITYNFEIDRHKFDIMLGQELNSGQGDDNYMYATNYSADLSPEKIFANMALSDGTIKIASQFNDDYNRSSFFGRLNYNMDDRYLFTATLRADGSSKFASDNRWGYFPAAAVAWRINQEPFMANTSNWLSNLKLRLSLGEAGNDKIKNALWKQNYAITTRKAYGIGDVLSGYYAPSNSELPNPNLKWETTVTRNIGLDFGFFDERISGTVEAYKNSANDLLIVRTIVAPGYDKTVENVGATSVKGFEFSLNSYVIDRRDFTLSANFNIGFNKSNVDRLAKGITEQEYASAWAGTDNKGYYDYKIRVGEPVGLIYGWVNDGYYTTDDFESYDEASDQYILKDGIPTTGLLGGRIGIRPGTIKLKDLDNSGVVDDTDRKVIGNTTPDFYGGFQINSTFHGFDAAILFNFVYGNDIYNANKIASSQQYRTNNPNMLSFMNGNNRYTYLDRNTGELVTDLAKLKAMNEGENAKEYWSPFSFGNANIVPTAWAIEDGSYLRLQNLTLGYTLPKIISQKASIQKFRVYATVTNLWTLTNYTGYDPEVSSPVRSSSTSGLTPGVDYSSYPKSLSWTFGINVTF